MSEKITFQELIESIAEETDNSKQFTHDFLKNFVDVINDGLKGGNDINIAGFGKFKLKQVDERQGYNPQTEEKMMIPAHHKMVFKPYKDLRERVNEPYAHLESKLIEEDKQESKTDVVPQKAAEDIETAKEETGNTPKPQSSAKSIEEELFGISQEADETDDAQTQKSAGEELHIETSSNFSLAAEDIEEEEKEKDIVEYSKIDDELAEFMGSEEPQPESSETETISEVNFSPTSPLGTDLEAQEPAQEKPVVSPSTVTYRKSRKGTAYVTAAVVLLIALAAGGSWYFLSGQNMQKVEWSPAISASAADVQLNNTESASNQSPKAAADHKMTSNQGEQTVQTGQNSASELRIAEGATLWSIAEEKLGNPRLWPWIYGTNESIENPDLIYAGATLFVPHPSGQPSGLSLSDSIAVARGYISVYQWYKGNNWQKAKFHLVTASSYHQNIRKLAGIQIEANDFAATNSAR